MTFFEVGKLPPDTLKKMLSKIDINDPRVVVGPRVGEDAAILDMGDRYLVATTDPITFTEERLGWYGVNINANDVAVKGAEPRWFTATLLLPEGKAEEALVESIFDDILDSCRLLNVTLCGGHTEITTGIDRPILVGQMLGEVKKDRLVSLEKIESGDVVLLTQGIAIEGTAILASAKREVLLKTTNAQMLSQASALREDPGISVVKAALTACRSANIHGMHDPTEGGIVTALWELGQASRQGMRIESEAIPILAETRHFCDILDIDPFGLISSGALLIVVRPEDSESVISSLSTARIPCTRIGRIVPEDEGLTISRGGKFVPLQPLKRDELIKVI
jgi:hydrogenase maturation factor